MAKNWIAKATSGNKGALRRTLHVKAGQTIPVAKLRAAATRHFGEYARLNFGAES